MTASRACILLLSLMFSSSALADLAIYDVDAQYRQEVFAALRELLSSQRPDAAHGTVERLPTGQILIDAAPETHAQIAAILKAINAYKAEPAPRVTLQYWAVLGSREIAGDTDTPPILADVLDEIRRSHGDLKFRVVGNAQLVTQSGQHGSLQGTPLSIRDQQADVEGETLNVELGIFFVYPLATGQRQEGDGSAPRTFNTYNLMNQSVQLTTSIERDEFVVVGENAIDNNDELKGTIFYIVHWPAAD